MLDLWLEHAYTKTKQAEDKQRFYTALEQLPTAELLAITRGESPINKVAHGDACWLDQFQGSPLYDQALALEKQSLELDMSDAAESTERQAAYSHRDALRVQRRMLELALSEERHRAAGGEPQMEAPAGAPPSVAMDPNGQPAPEGQAAVQPAAKMAAELTEAGRDKIKAKNFAVPAKSSDTGEAKYPIEDRAHAANALARVDQHGTTGEKSKVYAAVARKYPELARRSDVPEVKAKAEKTAEISAEKVAEMRARLAFEKTALNLGLLKNLGTSALNFAKANPTKAMALGGAAVGAAGGAMAGGPGHRLSGALGGAAGGAALGGAAGFAAPRISQDMKSGLTFGEAAKATAQQGGAHLNVLKDIATDKAKSMFGGIKDKLMPAKSEAAPAVGSLMPAAPAMPSAQMPTVVGG